MNSILPIFPLDLVVYPEERLPLHIFEDRYKVMINECYARQAPFGIVATVENKPAPFGTVMEVNRLVKIYQGGEMDVITIGKSVFRLKNFISKFENKPYFAGEVEDIEMLRDCELE